MNALQKMMVRVHNMTAQMMRMMGKSQKVGDSPDSGELSVPFDQLAPDALAFVIDNFAKQLWNDSESRQRLLPIVEKVHNDCIRLLIADGEESTEKDVGENLLVEFQSLSERGQFAAALVVIGGLLADNDANGHAMPDVPDADDGKLGTVN